MSMHLTLMGNASRGLPRNGLVALWDPYRDAYGLDATARAALQTGVDYSGRGNSLTYGATTNASTDDPLVLAILGTVHTFARNYGVARVMLERAVAIDPNAAWALSRLGWLNVYADRPEEAAEYFEKANRLSPLDPINFNNLVGIASARQVAGDDAGAADLFIRALQERPNTTWIHRNLTAALVGCGRLDEAKVSLAKVREAYPGFTVKRFRDAMVFTPRALDRMAVQLRELGVPEE